MILVPRLARSPRAAVAFLVAATLLVVAALFTGGVSSARAATPPTVTTGAPGPVLWTTPGAIDGAPIDAIACPSATLCVAVDRAGNVLWSTNPAGGPRAWSAANVDGGNDLTSIACPSTSLCVAVDGAGNAVTSTNPTGGAAAWTAAKIDTSQTQNNTDTAGPVLLRGVACPSTGLCVAVDAAGNALTSANPTGGAAAWTVNHADTSRSYDCSGGGLTCQPPLVGISCPSVALCAAVDFSGNVLTTSNPTAPGPWTSTSTTGGGLGSLWGISCPVAAFCATVDGTAGNVITFDPQAAAIQQRRFQASAVYGIWCQSPTLCLASAHARGGLSELLGSYDPGAHASIWSPSPLGAVNTIACPTPSLCLAGDDEGELVAGATTHGLATLFGATLLAHRRVPTIAGLDRTRQDRFVLASPIAGRVTLTWTLPGVAGVPVLLGSATHRFRTPGSATLTLRLTGAGVRFFRAATSQVTVSATATFAASTGSLSSARARTFAHPPKRRKPHRRRRH